MTEVEALKQAAWRIGEVYRAKLEGEDPRSLPISWQWVMKGDGEWLEVIWNNQGFYHAMLIRYSERFKVASQVVFVFEDVELEIKGREICELASWLASELTEGGDQGVR